MLFSAPVRLGLLRRCARFPWRTCATPAPAGTGAAATSPPSQDTHVPALLAGKVRTLFCLPLHSTNISKVLFKQLPPQ